ncbi:MAG: hypothetical protein HC919_07345 [Oscillatoriales cyanobacterium SM2_2_1]|nr:hypothetical protein [Oscillatoriales cyanobacterium SM2_2_1]
MITGFVWRSVVAIALVILSFSWQSAPAWANIQIKLKDLTYQSCPAEQSRNLVLGGGIMSARCYLIEGIAVNPKNKTVYNADVFGRVYDANGNDVMPERGRLGAIAEVPPGESHFEIMLSVPADQPDPLVLKQFKASGFTGNVRR